MMLYLAGPMRGKPLYNFQAFEDTYRYLEVELGHDVMSPHIIDMDTRRVRWECRIDDGQWGMQRMFTKVDLDPSFDMKDTMRLDLGILTTECNGIALMPGWMASTGALREAAVAAWCGLKAFMVNAKERTFHAYVLDERTIERLVFAHGNGTLVGVR